MTVYVKKALFVYEAASKSLCQYLQENPFGVEIDCVEIDQLETCHNTGTEEVTHVVVAGSIGLIKRVFALAKTGGFGVGLLALPEQRNLISCFDLPKNLAAAIDLALQEVAQPLDLIFCNDKILLFKATLGRIPLLDESGNSNRRQLLLKAAKQLVKLRLLPFRFTTAAGKIVDTCACGCTIIQHHRGGRAASLITHNSSSIDGRVSLWVSAPF